VRDLEPVEALSLDGGGDRLLVLLVYGDRPRRGDRVTAAEAMAATVEAGVTLDLDDQGRLVAIPPGRLAPEVRESIREHKDRLKSALRLRALHRGMGLSEEDVMFCERAIISGKVADIRLIVSPPRAGARPA
jgi:hypothetical protein